MSYSRWGSRGSGHWYTFWHCQPESETETIDNALFSVFGVAIFQAKHLRDDIESCLAVVAIKDKSANKIKLEELKTYMNEFLDDVNRKYKKVDNK